MNPCALCPRVNTCIPADSRCNDYTTVFVGEAPGFHENKKGQVFIGPTGKELDDHYLPLAGLRRSQCYITNAIKCFPVTNNGRLKMGDKKDMALLDSCTSAHLYPEIEAIQPSLIVPMGAFACHAIDPRINLDLHHGRPFETESGIMAFPMWHPAGGLHEPKKMLQIRTDWIRLKQYMNGTLEIAEDDYPNPQYLEVTDPAEILDLDVTQDMANDTEYSRSLGPYCLTYSVRPGTARLIRASNEEVLSTFADVIMQWEGRIWWHNWPYDSKVVSEMGIEYPLDRIRDTMLKTFHLGNLPQGLKALSFRELGMEMQDFEDLVKPYSIPEVLRYYHSAFLEKWPKPEPFDYRDADGVIKTKKPQSMSTKLKRFFTDYMKNDQKDVFEMWTKNWVESQSMIEEVCGIWPGMDIAHVPFEKVLHYACRDSDATLRMVPILERMAQQVKTGRPQETWRTA